jgi:hypothetical protein
LISHARWLALWRVRRDANYTLSKCWGTPPLVNQVDLEASTLHTPFENNGGQGATSRSMKARARAIGGISST